MPLLRLRVPPRGSKSCGLPLPTPLPGPSVCQNGAGEEDDYGTREGSVWAALSPAALRLGALLSVSMEQRGHGMSQVCSKALGGHPLVPDISALPPFLPNLMLIMIKTKLFQDSKNGTLLRGARISATCPVVRKRPKAACFISRS